MAVPFEKIAAEDLNVGFGALTITSPAGGTLAGNKVNLGRLLTPYIVPFSATPAFDLANGDVQTLTLTANVTSSTITIGSGSLFNGAILILWLVQDGTGSRTFAWPSDVKLAGGAFTLTTTADKRDSIILQYDGTNWYELSRTINL